MINRNSFQASPNFPYSQNLNAQSNFYKIILGYPSSIVNENPTVEEIFSINTLKEGMIIDQQKKIPRKLSEDKSDNSSEINYNMPIIEELGRLNQSNLSNIDSNIPEGNITKSTANKELKLKISEKV
jgi:hypothetical protein